MDTDVREVMDRTQWNQWINDAGVRARRVDGIDVRQRSAAQSKRDGMLTGVARFKTGSVVVVMRG